ncbi:MAG: MFS transporter [Pseudomonadota bacterium]
MATINTRVTTFGLADIRGGMGLGFDEASWLTTVFSAAQMIIGPAAAWLSTVFGVRRFLLWSSLIFAVTSLLLPFSRDYKIVIALQFLRGLSVGTFIPSALGFILRSLPPRWWIWGLAAYSFRFVFSQNIAGSLEAYWGDSGNWEWIFWQNTALTPIMTVLVWFGMPRDPVDRVLLRETDWGGIVFAGLGFGLIFTALDQGNRLDWLNSGVVTGLLLAGGLLVGAFLVNEAVVARPLIHLRVAATPNVLVPALLISLYGFGTTATAFVLPDYLTRVQGLRALEIGHVLNWIAIPQFLMVPLVVLLLRVVDARILLAIGFALIGLGSWMDTDLTHDWVNRDFLDSQIVEAAGLAIAITALVTFAVANIVPAQAAAIAATIQTARLFGSRGRQRLHPDPRAGARAGLFLPHRVAARDRLRQHRARARAILEPVRGPRGRQRRRNRARRLHDGAAGPARGLRLGLYRWLLDDRLDFGRRAAAPAAAPTAAAQPADPKPAGLTTNQAGSAVGALDPRAAAHARLQGPRAGARSPAAAARSRRARHGRRAARRTTTRS